MDDILVIGSTQKEIDEINRALTGEFKMSDLGPVSWYLGLKITCDLSAGKMFLSQSPYVEKILGAFSDAASKKRRYSNGEAARISTR